MMGENRAKILTIRWPLLPLLWVVASSLSFGAGTTTRASAQVQHTLAPTGALRVALYTGTPTSLVSEHDLRGVGYELGREFARRLGVPFQPLVYPRNADVLDAIKAGRADVAFTNATVERAKDMDFTAPYLIIELGYLVREGGPVVKLTDVDRPGVRVGVSANSTSDTLLTRRLKFARVVRADTVAMGIRMLATRTIDVYATNKATLFGMARKVRGAKVLDGSWGQERHALGLPKGRERGLPFAQAFIADATATGFVQAAVKKADVQGAVVANSSH